MKRKRNCWEIFATFQLTKEFDLIIIFSIINLHMATHRTEYSDSDDD